MGGYCFLLTFKNSLSTKFHQNCIYYNLFILVQRKLYMFIAVAGFQSDQKSIITALYCNDGKNTAGLIGAIFALPWFIPVQAVINTKCFKNIAVNKPSINLPY